MARTDRGFEGGGAPASGISARGAARIKINTNPNKTPAKGYNGYKKTVAEEKAIDAARKAHYNIPKNEKVVTRIKVNSNPVTNHQPRIGGHSS